MINDSKKQSSSPAPKSKAKNDVHTSNSRVESPAKRITISCRFGARCKCTSCNFWHPPMGHHYKTESGCKYVRNCQFRQSDAEEAPSTKSRKESAEGSVALLREKSPNWLCFFFFSESWRIEIERFSGTQGKILRKHLAPDSKFGQEKGHLEESSQSASLSVVLARQGSRTDHMRKPQGKRVGPAKQRGTWRKT